MDPEELPRKKADMVIGENLEAISVSELEQRIAILESEIARIKADITKKQASKAAAASFFKS